ncbi:hypothetical protein TSUD_170500 [Trifolium subterraneum]|uniref:Calmodulin-binding domain-containing protein n=1 Tax=Trifolium subterraneum TaxID=3900 RepID=A0A2Z6LPF1_TRISU|nr:hypothetical protein TSUD_170500 [Trifolium subterraneum]
MMAEESVHVPMVSDEVTMSRVVELRRPSSGTNGEKRVPHYRRASMGSCHDICKYGKNIAVEANKRSFIPKLAERKQLLQSSQKNIGEVIVASGIKLQASDTTKVIKTGPGRLVQPNNEVVVNKVKQSLPLRDLQNSSIYKTRRQEISSSSKMDSIPKPISKKEEPLLKSISQRVKTHPISTSQMVKTSSKSISKKTRHLSVDLDSSKVASQRASWSTSHMVKTSSKSTSKKTRHLSMDLGSSKVASPRASSSPKSFQKRIAGINIHKSLKTVSRVKNQPKPRKVEPAEQCNEVKEKTLYVIIESEDQTFQSDQNENLDIELSSNAQNATSELEEDSCLGNNGKENMDNLEILDLEGEENEKRQKGETENLDIMDLEVEESEKPQKGETENSEILDLEVEENEKPQEGETENLVESQMEKSSPRELEFGRGKVSKDNDNDDKVDADETDVITGVEKVVLRHQDVKGKKDEQVLLNTVIEETASKLVEIERSKVKALIDMPSCLCIHCLPLV